MDYKKELIELRDITQEDIDFITDEDSIEDKYARMANKITVTRINDILKRGEEDSSNEATATLPINSVMPRLIIQGIEFNKPDKDNEAEIVVPSHGYDDDNHIWLTIDELKQIGKFYFNGV